MTDPKELTAEAERKCKAGFWAIFKGGPQYDEASELYVTAASQYKLRGLWKEAANCYARAAELQEKAEDKNAEAKYYVEAGHVMKKVSAASASDHYQKASDIYTQSGRFSQAAKLMKSLAEEFEADNDLKAAQKYWKLAADYFALDEYGKTSYSQCIGKYAEAAAKLDGSFDEAILIFETEAQKALKSSLVQFGAKDQFFKAGILHLVKGDAITASVQCDSYGEMDPRFKTSREGRLLKALCKAYEEDKVDDFVDALSEYDRVTTLDPWKIHFLSQVKLSMTGGDRVSTKPNVSAPPPDTLTVTDETGEIDLT